MISYRRDLVTLQAGVSEDNFHNFYLTANSSTMETPIWAGVHIVNPAGLPMWSQKMCVGSQAGLNSGSSTLQTVPQNYQNSKLLRLIERGSMSPTCGSTLRLGSP